MLGEPLENDLTSRSMPSAVMVRIAPLPNCFSMVETARAIAFPLLSSVDVAAPLVRAALLLAAILSFLQFESSRFEQLNSIESMG